MYDVYMSIKKMFWDSQKTSRFNLLITLEFTPSSLDKLGNVARGELCPESTKDVTDVSRRMIRSSYTTIGLNVACTGAMILDGIRKGGVQNIFKTVKTEGPHIHFLETCTAKMMNVLLQDQMSWHVAKCCSFAVIFQFHMKKSWANSPFFGFQPYRGSYHHLWEGKALWRGNGGPSCDSRRQIYRRPRGPSVLKGMIRKSESWHLKVLEVKNLVVVSKYVLFVSPIWGRFPFWRAFFSKGLVQPPTRKILGKIFFGVQWKILKITKDQMSFTYNHRLLKNKHFAPGVGWTLTFAGGALVKELLVKARHVEGSCSGGRWVEGILVMSIRVDGIQDS